MNSEKLRIYDRGLNHPARVIRKSAKSNHRFRILIPLLWTVLLFSAELFAVSVEVVAVNSFLKEPPALEQVFPYVINLVSHTRPLDSSAIKPFDKLTDDLVYYSRVKVDGVTYYRLSLGNFSTRRQAQIVLNKVNTYFPDAWVGKRTKQAQRVLSNAVNLVNEGLIAEIKSEPSKVKIPTPIKTNSSGISRETSLANKLSQQAKEEFLNQNYQQVIRISDKLIEIGDLGERQEAMELAGLARERQGKFAQAIAIYQSFLDLYPQSDIKPRIKQRLQGLKTMNLDPKQPIVNRARVNEDLAPWDMRGGLSNIIAKTYWTVEK